jgi:hypothetical protein
MLQPAGKAVGYRVFTNGYGRSMSASSAVKLVVKNGPPSPRPEVESKPQREVRTPVSMPGRPQLLADEQI